ncbi:histone deacetylase 8-like [Arctopsyche grandis]|uniref:histone deacetylase 8-like n=1 Tax=Arctopsyche grandis TaxID=121162 RepID=UPI00406D864C
MEHSVSYIFDDKLLEHCDKLPPVKQRASMVHALIESYELLKYMNIIPSVKATPEDLQLFHSSSFVKCMKESNDLDLDDVNEEQIEFGLGYDCPPFENIFETILTIAGGSLTAASRLVSEDTKIAINWCGGWHHAQRDEAEGFCYVNDIVIGIEKLREKFKRILYIDLDIHHGNGVENAFAFSKKVFTLSFHKHEPGFYPGSGLLSDVGLGNGRGYSCNVPLKEGVSDYSLNYLFKIICPQIYEAYQPEVVVVQCGSDCLNEDPLGQSNLTLDSLGECIRSILNWNKPTLFLGGGGYNLPNTARLWTYLTAIITGQDKLISMDIPDNDFFLKYGPGYELPIVKGNQKDTNDKTYLDCIIKTVKDNLKKYDVKSSL